MAMHIVPASASLCKHWHALHARTTSVPSSWNACLEVENLKLAAASSARSKQDCNVPRLFWRPMSSSDQQAVHSRHHITTLSSIVDRQRGWQSRSQPFFMEDYTESGSSALRHHVHKLHFGSTSYGLRRRDSRIACVQVIHLPSFWKAWMQRDHALFVHGKDKKCLCRVVIAYEAVVSKPRLRFWKFEANATSCSSRMCCLSMYSRAVCFDAAWLIVGPCQAW